MAAELPQEPKLKPCLLPVALRQLLEAVMLAEADFGSVAHRGVAGHRLFGSFELGQLASLWESSCCMS